MVTVKMYADRAQAVQWSCQPGWHEVQVPEDMTADAREWLARHVRAQNGRDSTEPAGSLQAWRSSGERDPGEYPPTTQGLIAWIDESRAGVAARDAEHAERESARRREADVREARLLAAPLDDLVHEDPYDRRWCVVRDCPDARATDAAEIAAERNRRRAAEKAEAAAIERRRNLARREAELAALMSAGHPIGPTPRDADGHLLPNACERIELTWKRAHTPAPGASRKWFALGAGPAREQDPTDDQLRALDHLARADAYLAASDDIAVPTGLATGEQCAWWMIDVHQYLRAIDEPDDDDSDSEGDE